MIQDRKKLEDNYTMSATISAGSKKAITNYKTSILAAVKDGDDIIEYPTNNLLYEYLDEINPVRSVYNMTEDEYTRYCMRPDLFCYDIYGDQDLEWIILALNNILSPSDFTKKSVYYINEQYISKLMSTIINAENNYMIYNRSNYMKNIDINEDEE